MQKRNIEDLYEEMFETIKMVKEDEIDIQKAQVVANLGKVIVDAAKAEVSFRKVSESRKSDFLLDDATREKLEMEAKKALPENQKYFKREES